MCNAYANVNFLRSSPRRTETASRGAHRNMKPRYLRALPCPLPRRHVVMKEELMPESLAAAFYRWKITPMILSSARCKQKLANAVWALARPRAYASCIFSDEVTYSKLLTQLLKSFPSPWLTSTCSAEDGGPRSVRATSLCTNMSR